MGRLMARRMPGLFVPSDVNTIHDPKIRAAGFKAELLFRRGNEHAKSLGSDGLLWKYDLPIFGIGIPSPSASAARLVEVKLWRDLGDRWRIEGWMKWNLSQDDLKEEKELRRIGALKTNHGKGHHTESVRDCPLCNPSEPLPL